MRHRFPAVTEATSTQRVDSKPRNLDVHLVHHPVDTYWLSHRYKSPTALSQGKTDCGTKVYISKLPWSSGWSWAFIWPSSLHSSISFPIHCCCSFSPGSSKENSLNKSQCAQIPNHLELQEPDDLCHRSLHLVLTITVKEALIICILISRKWKSEKIGDVPSAAWQVCDGARIQSQALCNSPFPTKLSCLLTKTLRLKMVVPWSGLV